MRDVKDVESGSIVERHHYKPVVWQNLAIDELEVRLLNGLDGGYVAGQAL